MRRLVNRTPPHEASRYRHADNIRFFPERSANVDAEIRLVEHRCILVLILGARDGLFAASQLLVKHGTIIYVGIRAVGHHYTRHQTAPPGTQNRRGRTGQRARNVLNKAALEGKQKAAQPLLSYEVNVHTRNKARSTPVQLALVNGYEVVIWLLSEHALGGTVM